MYGRPCKRDWMTKVVFLIQILLTVGGRCNRYFWNIRLKILRLPNFNMLFQLVLTKLFKGELFTWLPKVGQVIKSCKEPIVFYNSRHICWNSCYVDTSSPIMIHVLPPICKYTQLDASTTWFQTSNLIQSNRMAVAENKTQKCRKGLANYYILMYL